MKRFNQVFDTKPKEDQVPVLKFEKSVDKTEVKTTIKTSFEENINGKTFVYSGKDFYVILKNVTYRQYQDNKHFGAVEGIVQQGGQSLGLLPGESYTVNYVMLSDFETGRKDLCC